MNNIFGTYPMQLFDWAYPIALGVIVFVIIEIEKSIMRGIDGIKYRRNLIT